MVDTVMHALRIALQFIAGTIVTLGGLALLAFVVCYARHLLGGA
jgi:hypothetical protein